ncbi:MAG: hypothetical protein ABL875_09185 [Candidatus Nitrotoga sp.]
MISKKIILSAISGLVVLTAANSYAAQVRNSTDNVMAREASEGPRGADKERPGDRQGRGGRLSTDGASQFILAREASEGPRGADKERPGDRQGRGGRLSADGASQFILAREASEGPRGADKERPGDRQGRGGRNA